MGEGLSNVYPLIRKAFDETIIPGKKKHSNLRKLLNKASNVSVAAKVTTKCPHGCGRIWNKTEEEAKKLKVKQKGVEYNLCLFYQN